MMTIDMFELLEFLKKEAIICRTKDGLRAYTKVALWVNEKMNKMDKELSKNMEGIV